MDNTALIGNHSSIADGVLNSLKYTATIGGNITQIFLGSNRSAKLSSKTKLTAKEITEICEWTKKNNHHIVIHCTYILNLCKKNMDYAINNIIYDMETGAKIGVLGCVLHYGHHTEITRTEGLNNMIANINKLFEKLDKKCKSYLILETSASTKQQIGNTTEEMQFIYDGIDKKNKKRVKFCVDTAHIFSSGYDIRTVEGINDYFNNFEKLIGVKNIACFHINDSKAEYKTGKDQHAGLGDGHIFKNNIKVLEHLINFAKNNKIPIILETHKGGYYGDDGGYYQEIQLLKQSTFDPNFKLTLPYDISHIPRVI